tara:strand:- start:102 stop:308 length:207 start_codon:yes stop_codon:yes gene_type:complete
MKQNKIARFLIHFAGWSVVMLFIFWMSGLTDYFSKDAINTHGATGYKAILTWLVASACCTPMTLIRDK